MTAVSAFLQRFRLGGVALDQSRPQLYGCSSFFFGTLSAVYDAGFNRCRSGDDIQAMSALRPERLFDELIAQRNPDGSWGYRPATSGSAESTALACLALAAFPGAREANARSLAWLVALQRADGGIPVAAGVPSPCWPTALGVLAWLAETHDATSRYKTSIAQAVSWLLKTEGRRIKWNPDLFGHDTTLAGWPWVAGTHSWVEPTAYALLALRAAGRGDHARVREGVRLLYDRALPGGGWNYGNTRVLKSTLRPFPATTGIVLTALAGSRKNPRIEASIHYLAEELPHVDSPLSLSWGVIGLKAWGRCPADAHHRLARSADRTPRAQRNTLHTALLLLALSEGGVLLNRATRADSRG